MGLESALALAGTQPVPQPRLYLPKRPGFFLLAAPHLGPHSQPCRAHFSFPLPQARLHLWGLLSAPFDIVRQILGGSLCALDLVSKTVLPRPVSWPELPLGPDPMGLVAPVVPRTSPG